MDTILLLVGFALIAWGAAAVITTFISPRIRERRPTFLRTGLIALAVGVVLGGIGVAMVRGNPDALPANRIEQP